MKDFSVTFLAILLLLGCRPSTPQSAINQSVNLEIKNRLDVLQKLSAQNDVLRNEMVNLSDNMNHLLLLSKDVENNSACVNLGNSFFEEMTDVYGIDRTKFKILDSRMTMSEMEEALKMNELSVLNFFVSEFKGKDILLYSAGESANG